ncbi:MAG: putative zinc-binding peptidase [Pseudomonadales bacterium]|nr:putative zinc-binding peptidase [Pseudomonadales bacterium]
MRSFNCQVCGQQIYFENTQCLRCLHTLGFLPDRLDMVALEPRSDGLWAPAGEDGALYKPCRNTVDWQNCNWLIPADSEAEYCESCDLNATIPDLSAPGNRDYWITLEKGKRRLVYSLKRLGLPIVSKKQDEKRGIAFEFLRSGVPGDNDDQVMTGHINGLITVNVHEADDLERERIRLNLNEVYRTVLGHFRHEIGHYYWWRYVHRSSLIRKFRKLFGDERSDYDACIATYYQTGPLPNWQTSFVSAYASSHPWEDWAECFAHYLTIVDSMDTAQAFGVVLAVDRTRNLFPMEDAYHADSFDNMLEQWLPLTFAMNSINRSAGQRDLYPFVLPGPAIAKLRFVHEVIKANARPCAE